MLSCNFRTLIQIRLFQVRRTKRCEKWARPDPVWRRGASRLQHDRRAFQRTEARQESSEAEAEASQETFRLGQRWQRHSGQRLILNLLLWGGIHTITLITSSWRVWQQIGNSDCPSNVRANITRLIVLLCPELYVLANAPSNVRNCAERFWAYRVLEAIWIKCVLCSYFDKNLYLFSQFTKLVIYFELC